MTTMPSASFSTMTTMPSASFSTMTTMPSASFSTMTTMPSASVLRHQSSDYIGENVLIVHGTAKPSLRGGPDEARISEAADKDQVHAAVHRCHVQRPGQTGQETAHHSHRTRPCGDHSRMARGPKSSEARSEEEASSTPCQPVEGTP